MTRYRLCPSDGVTPLPGRMYALGYAEDRARKLSLLPTHAGRNIHVHRTADGRAYSVESTWHKGRKVARGLVFPPTKEKTP